MSGSTKMKRCTKCNEAWPNDREFYYRSGFTPDGLHSWCIACVKQYNRERRGNVWEPAQRIRPMRTAAQWKLSMLNRVRMYFEMAERRKREAFKRWCVFTVLE